MLSPEREGRLTGSMVGAALGQNPYCSRQEAWRLLTKRKTFEGNEMTEWGNVHEVDALHKYECYTGDLVDYTLDDQKFYIDMKHDWMGCTPDGILGMKVIEFKCPWSLKIPESVPLHYMAQAQFNMMITNRPECDFLYWTPERSKMFNFKRSDEYLEQALPILEEFWAYVKEDKEPKRKKKPVFPIIKTEVIFDE